MIENSNMTPERFAELHPRIQQKILAAREAVARREQKKEDREVLKSWLRFKELEAIPVKQRSRDEHNEYQRLRRQQKKLADKGEQTVTERVEERVRSAEDFWRLNSIGQTKLGEWRERQEAVLDTLAWMDRVANGTETEELSGENYVSLEEGAQDILDDIEAHGTARLGYIHEDEDISGDFFDGYFTGRAFWRTPEVFRALCAEGEPTRVYVTTGILIALPDWKVIEFLVNHCHWKPREAQEHVGYKFSPSTTRVRY